MSRRSRGFTLIELLVVVAIIAILIAILLPSLGRAKQNAKRVQCMGALKGWGQVIGAYETDNAGAFCSKNSAGTWASTPGVYDNYFAGAPSIPGFNGINNKMVPKFRVCPAEVQHPLGQANPAGGWNNELGNRVQVNYLHVRFNPKPLSSSGMTIFNITKLGGNPAGKMLMADGYWNNGTNIGNIQNPDGRLDHCDGIVLTANDTFNRVPAFDMGQLLKDRHGGNGQIVFCDGHAESLPYSEWLANIPDQPFTATPSAADATKLFSVITTQ